MSAKDFVKSQIEKAVDDDTLDFRFLYDIHLCHASGIGLCLVQLEVALAFHAGPAEGATHKFEKQETQIPPYSAS